MGILYDLYIATRSRKRCTECGCTLYDDSDVDICELCVSEMYDD